MASATNPLELADCIAQLEELSKAVYTGQTMDVIKGALDRLAHCEGIIRTAAATTSPETQTQLNDQVVRVHQQIILATKWAAEGKKNEGTAAFKAGAFAEALARYEEAIAIDSSDPVYYSNVALALQKLERWEEALVQAERAVQLDRNYLKGYVILIKSQLKLEHYESAGRLLLEIEGNFVSNQKDLLELKQSASTGAKDTGNKFFKESKYDEALEYYSLAINLNRTNHLLYSNRSACYQAKKLWAEAAEDAKAAIGISSQFAKGHLHFVRSLIQLKKYDESLVAIETAKLQLQPTEEWGALQGQFDELVSQIKAKKLGPGVSPQDRARAESFKTRGDQSYRDGEYQDAIRLYSQAIAICPNEGLYYGNRSASWVMLKEFNQAISDCNTGLQFEVKYGDLNKLRMRKAKAFISIGKFDEAVAVVQEPISKAHDGTFSTTSSSIAPFEDQLKSLETIKTNLDLGKAALESREFSRAKRLFQIVQSAGVSDDRQLLVLLAKAHIQLGELEEGARVAQAAIATKAGGNVLDAYVARGEALAGLGLTDQAAKHYSAALQLDPDNQDTLQKLKFLRKVMSGLASLRQAYDEAIAAKDFEKAIQSATEGLVIDRNNKKIMAESHYKRGKAYQLLAKEQSKSAGATAAADASGSSDSPAITSYRQCLKDANSATYYDKNMLQAIYLKVDTLQSLGRHEEAVQEIEACVKDGPGKEDDGAEEKLKTAQRLLKQSKRKNFYAVLGLQNGSDASEEEIKKAYKKSALKWHPDRHSSGTEEQKKEAESRFKDINAAFELLTDPTRKRLYDQGYDMDEIDQRVEMEKQRREGGGGGGHHHGFGGHRGGFPGGGFPGGFGGFH